MIKKIALVVLSIAITGSMAFGAAGIYDPYAIVNGTFYDLGGASVNPDYQGANLGTFDPATDQLFLGGQQKSFKNNGTDVTAHILDWRIWQGSPSGSFSQINYSFQWNQGDSGAPGNLNNPGDQQWGTDVQGANTTDDAVNILTGLANGVYTLELFSQINTNGVNADPTIYNNNGGSNFTATFTVVPEPSVVSLLAGSSVLGASFYLRRRRRA